METTLETRRGAGRHACRPEQRDEPPHLALGSSLARAQRALSDAVAIETDAEVSEWLVRSIVASDDPRSVDALILALSNPTADVREWAVRGLGPSRDERAVDALSKIADHQPDLIFVDIMMPRLDGYETCSLIKHNKMFKETPVIMLSSKDGLFDRARGRIVGSEQYLTKPFTKDELLGAISNQIN